MKVFIINPTIAYSFGCALIAANNIQEAINTYTKEEYKSYIYEECKCKCGLIEKLDYETDVPTVIIDTIQED